VNSLRLVVAVVAAIVLLVLGAIHVRWAFRGNVEQSSGLPTRHDGSLLFRPGKGSTLAVAAALALAAYIVLGGAAVAPPIIGTTAVYHIGTLGVGTVFALRVVGEFRYVGLFKRVRSTAFARLDTRLFTPLCAAIAAAAFYVALADR
jgi:hypothetical protein